MPQFIISLLGGSGSVGQQALESLSNFSNINLHWELLTLDETDREKNIKLIKELQPKIVYIYNCEYPVLYEKEFSNITFIKDDKELLTTLKKLNGIVINALPGEIGAESSMVLIRRNVVLMLANKETLLLFGDEFIKRVKKTKQQVYPLDSEMVAIKELFRNYDVNSIDKVIITASGGALRNLTYEEYINTTKDKILSHPTWQMGQEITVNSATLVNKVFEIIEAHYLFNIDYQKIKVVVNLESMVHAGFILNSGSTILNTSNPSMISSITIMLDEVFKHGIKIPEMDFNSLNLNFKNFILDQFPLYKLGLIIIKKNNLSLIKAYYYTNQYLVNLFLNDQISFRDLNIAFTKVFDTLLATNTLPRTNQEIKSIVHNMTYLLLEKEKHCGSC